MVRDSDGLSSALMGELDALSEPSRSPGFVDLCGGDRKHGFLSLVDVEWVRAPRAVVEEDEHHQRRPRRTHVPVEEWVVPRQSFNLPQIPNREPGPILRAG